MELVGYGLWHLVVGAADDPAPNLTGRECEGNALESRSGFDGVTERAYVTVLTARQSVIYMIPMRNIKDQPRGTYKKSIFGPGIKWAWGIHVCRG